MFLKNIHMHNIFLNFKFIKALISNPTSNAYNPIEIMMLEQMNLDKNMNNLSSNKLSVNNQKDEDVNDNINMSNVENISKLDSSSILLASVILCTPSLSYTTDMITLTDNYLNTNQDSNSLGKNMDTNLDMIELSNWLKNINIEYIVSSPSSSNQTHQVKYEIIQHKYNIYSSISCCNKLLYVFKDLIF